MAHSDDVPMDSQYMDYAEHERTYHFFISMVKRVSIVLVVIICLMAFFLV